MDSFKGNFEVASKTRAPAHLAAEHANSSFPRCSSGAGDEGATSYLVADFVARLKES